MATLETIRNRAGILVSIVIGLALFAFILGDILGSGPSLFTKNQFEIAEIGGKSISYQSFQNKVDELTEIYKLNTGQTMLETEVYETILEQAWQALLRENILEKEYESIGLEVSPDELFDMVQGNNIHPYIRQLFTDPATGTFNRSAVIQFLRTMNQDPTGQSRAYWIYLESEIAQERKMAKYNSLISQGLFANELEARNSWLENNKRVDIDYVIARYTMIHDSLVSVSDSELKRFYRQNREQYTQNESRDIQYIAFDITPSEEDDLRAREWIENMVDEFYDVQEVRQFINLNSDTPFGDFNYSYNELPETIADFMFLAEPGEIYGPYFEDSKYKLSRLLEVNFLPDSVRARHILIQPNPHLDNDAARNRADSILEVVRRGGNFESLAMEFSDDTGSSFEGGNLGWFREGMMVPEFNDAVFSARTGTPFLVETQFGFHITEVNNRSAETKKIKYATLSREVTPSSSTYQRIYSKASQFAGVNNSYDKLIDASAEQGIQVRSANNILPSDQRIPGLSSARELIRWAYGAGEKSLSPIMEIDNKFVIATVNSIRKEGYIPFENISEDIKSILVRKKKGEIIATRMMAAFEESGDLYGVSSAINSEVQQAGNISFSSFSVQNAGIEPALISTAVSLGENQFSNPVIGENGVYLIYIRDVSMPEIADYEIEYLRLNNSRRARVNFEVFEALIKQANVTDNRHKFF